MSTRTFPKSAAPESRKCPLLYFEVFMGKINNLLGQRFGRLTVIEYAGKDKSNKAMWVCKCDCGNIKTIVGNNFVRGIVVSCGCKGKENREKAAKAAYKHGGRGTRLYRVWKNMRTRCYCEKFIEFDCYGGRGIKMCPQWEHDFSSFKEWALKNGYDDSLTIERIDVNGDYSPENCKWATYKEQANNKRNNSFIQYKNKLYTLTQFCEEFNLNYRNCYTRYKKGFTAQQLIDYCENLKKEVNS